VIRQASTLEASSNLTRISRKRDWQTAYDERALDASGSAITESFELSDRPDLLRGDVRLVFFVHYLDLARPIRTPFGGVDLPDPSDWPDRLASIEYEQP
jgi:hypothetical protein